MEDAFNFLHGLFIGQVEGAMMIWVLVGGIVFLLGLLLLGICAIYPMTGERVTLQVVDLLEVARKIDDDDDAESIAKKKANPKIKPVFEILEGPHFGQRVKSSSASYPAAHALGDTTPGYYNAKSQDAASVKELGTGLKFALCMIAIGLGVILMSNFVSGQMS